MAQPIEQPVIQKSNSVSNIDPSAVKDLATNMHQNLQHASQVMNDALSKNSGLLTKLHHMLTQSEEASTMSKEAEPTTNNVQVSDPVQAAVHEASDHDGSLFHKLQQKAHQYIHEAESSISERIHHGATELEADYKSVQSSTYKHILDAEQAIQQSLTSIRNIVGGNDSNTDQQPLNPQVTQPQAVQPQAVQPQESNIHSNPSVSNGTNE